MILPLWSTLECYNVGQIPEVDYCTSCRNAPKLKSSDPAQKLQISFARRANKRVTRGEKGATSVLRSFSRSGQEIKRGSGGAIIINTLGRDLRKEIKLCAAHVACQRHPQRVRTGISRSASPLLFSAPRALQTLYVYYRGETIRQPLLGFGGVTRALSGAGG